ncbi:hypothetical protein CI1B_31060 [Bradyrhizobium ivorense]|uniref:Uncharacterized protein n=1 Tax=Bradyrhizobium ivorense TaxID=2511166 RepID=A0A508T4Y9_9BRAD|nr:hypothetical protein [Bradyrhizobium ivorense]VIO70452.1 hypothetical protein CI1B_31060 [Bradyrhizobium ivorense]
MSIKAHMTHRRVIAKFPTKGDEMTSDEDNFMESFVAADSVGKSEIELRAQRADTFAALETALAVDVAEELSELSAMDIEIIDPARHVETMTALLEADELVTHLLLAIDEIKRQVAKTPNSRRQIGRRKRTEKDKKRRLIRD